MALFQVSVLKNYLRLQDEQIVEKAYKKFTKYFHNQTIQENIKSSKEEQFQATFLNELFVNILGYTLNPQPDYNLTTEFKNQQNARKADGAILKDNQAIGVIELKGTNTKHLEGIRQQAFDYKANQKDCIYVITSNFEKLRFYINDATEFIEFDLFGLTRNDFSLLWLCLNYDNISTGIPLKIKEASLVKEEAITKDFYKDYSLFKRELYRDLVRRNAKRLKSVRESELLSQEYQDSEKFESEISGLEKNVKKSLFKKSQKLIDRFLFIFFAEDRGLLPPNSIHKIIADWNKLKDLDAEMPLYERFKLYFGYLDTGRKGTDSRAEIFAYNGGLFKPDTILDLLEVDDKLLYKHTAKLATYDFESQVDVNILGHIFENSLNEIESINAEIEGGEFDKQTSKRKKDGVFYTPKYITKYIVENTVGKLCNEKKNELNFHEEEYFEVKKGTHKNTKKKLLQTLDDYRSWLLQLTICDPACGSGAFLNQALDFLIKEHQYIDELKAKVLGGALVFSDIENTILENNIYGVDINEESVEIAKLSLWLRTAQPRRKLNDLSSNIKCGNSLIDDPKVTGDKAFKWNEEFPEVFEKGGFDVIIGNPPYVRNEHLISNVKNYFANNYTVHTGKSDLYVYFFEKACQILRNDGNCGFIVSSKYTKTKYGKVLIDYLQRSISINQFIDFKDLDVFKGIVAYPSIITFSSNINKQNKTTSKLLVVNNDNFQEIENYFNGLITVNQDDIFRRLGSWTTGSIKDGLFDLIKMLEEKNSTLLKLIGKPEVGIKTGFNSAYIYNSESLPQEVEGNDFLVNYIIGREVKKYNGDNYHHKILFPYIREGSKLDLIKNPEKFPSLFNFLEGYKDNLSSRAIIDKGIEKGTKRWYEYQQIKTDFPYNEKYIIYPDISNGVNFSIVENSLYDMTCFGIPTDSKNLLGILNSKLICTYLNAICVKARGGYLRLKNQYICKIPLPELFEKSRIEDEVDVILNLNSEFYKVENQFVNFIINTFNVIIGKKLQNWHELEFGDFIKELNKTIKKTNRGRAKEGQEPVKVLTKKDEFEWMELFEENKKKAVVLQQQIDQTDRKIDQMVYELYGLTDEEIHIVENS